MDKKDNKNSIVKNVKLLITIVIIGLFVWFIILAPFITFKKNESAMEKAAKRYFEINSGELPTGERVGTVTLKQLYYKKIVTEDMFIPYTKEPCSVDDSWVKITKEDGEYKYYTYLKCGVLSSNVDHKGPEITLNGKDSITVSKGETYKDAGISSVVDNTDGKIAKSKVTTKNNVDTTKVGNYEVTYTVVDKLKNKTTVTRKVNVVERLKSTVKSATNKKGYYTGYDANNYISFSGMLFRIVDIDGDNVRIVANEDVANVDYNGISSWLDYYYEHINDNSKKYIVENKYCNMKLTDTTLDTTECQGYTKNVKVYIPSVVEINKAETTEGNFLRPNTMSWTANTIGSKQALLTRNIFYDTAYGSKYLPYNKTDNYGVRPMMTIKGNTEILSGTGTKENPYSIGDVEKAKGGQYVNKRTSGEYVRFGNMTYRIVNIENDNTTKIISTGSIFNNQEKVEFNYDSTKKTIYNPSQTSNVGYNINNRISEYLDVSLFVNHKISVPIYKNKINYGKETDTKTYKVKLSAPNMYEMFSAQDANNENAKSYWLLNSSNNKNTVGAIYDAGAPVNEEIEDFDLFGVRVVGYLDKATVISSGKGTYDNPYVLTK